MPIEAQPNSATPKRRRWQFGLRTLLGLVTVIAIGLGSTVVPAELQKLAVAEVRRMGGDIVYADEIPEYGPGIAPKWVRKLLGDDYVTSVARINLNDSQVDDAGVARITALNDSESLELRNTQVSDTGLAHLDAMASLEWLDLEGTRVTDDGLVHLVGMRELLWLHLGRNNVSDAGLVHLKKLTGLQWLYLSKTQVSHAGVAELRAALPRCKIIGP